MKKLVSLALVAALASASMLSACSNSQSGSSGADSGTSEGTKKVSVEVFDRNQAATGSTTTDNGITRWIQQKFKKDTGIGLTFVGIPRSEEVDKLNVMMAGGTAPDIVFTYSSSVAANYAKSGGIFDLKPYLDKYGSHIKTDLKECLPYGVMYGKQYSIPTRRVDEDDKYMTYVNTTLLKKYSLKVPTTKKEFYNDLLVIKKNEPKVIPYAMAAPSNAVSYFSDMVMSYAKYKDYKEFYMFNNESTKLVSPGTKEGYRELNKWYSEGLISKDFALDTQEKQWQSDLSNGIAFSWTCEQRGALDYINTAKKANGSEYTITNTFENDKGEYFKDLNWPIGVYDMIPKSSKNAEAAIKYLDWMHTGDNFKNIRTGAALGLAKTEDGITLSPSDDTLKAKAGVNNTILFDLGTPCKSDVECTSKQQYVLRWEKTCGTQMKSFFEKYYAISKPKGSYLPPYGVATDAETKYGTNIQKQIPSMVARLIVCKPSEFDSLWDKEYNSLLSNGLQQIIDDRSKQYDENKIDGSSKQP